MVAAMEVVEALRNLAMDLSATAVRSLVALLVDAPPWAVQKLLAHASRAVVVAAVGWVQQKRNMMASLHEHSN